MGRYDEKDLSFLASLLLSSLVGWFLSHISFRDGDVISPVPAVRRLNFSLVEWLLILTRAMASFHFILHSLISLLYSTSLYLLNWTLMQLGEDDESRKVVVFIGISPPIVVALILFSVYNFLLCTDAPIKLDAKFLSYKIKPAVLTIVRIGSSNPCRYKFDFQIVIFYWACHLLSERQTMLQRTSVAIIVKRNYPSVKTIPNECVSSSRSSRPVSYLRTETMRLRRKGGGLAQVESCLNRTTQIPKCDWIGTLFPSDGETNRLSRNWQNVVFEHFILWVWSFLFVVGQRSKRVKCSVDNQWSKRNCMLFMVSRWWCTICYHHFWMVFVSIVSLL